MPPSSPSSAGATYLDKTQRIEDLREAARRAAVRLPVMRQAILFGSLISGIPTPRSDADLLIVLDASEHAQMRDRVPAVLAAMTPLPCPIDLFVLTVDEFERARREGDAFVREALARGLDLLNPVA
jgi:predicted nucleotidyltransferase